MKRLILFAVFGMVLLASAQGLCQDYVFHVSKITGVDEQNTKVESTLTLSVQDTDHVIGILKIKNLGTKALFMNSISDQIFIVDESDANFGFSLKHPGGETGSINPFDQVEVEFLNRQDEFARNLVGILEDGKISKVAVVLDSINLMFYYEQKQ